MTPISDEYLAALEEAPQDWDHVGHDVIPKLISALREARAERDEAKLNACQYGDKETCLFVSERDRARAWSSRWKCGMRNRIQPRFVKLVAETRAKAEAENARLREAVEKAEKWLRIDDECGWPPSKPRSEARESFRLALAAAVRKEGQGE